MKKNRKQKILRYREIYMLLIPVIVYFLVFSYYPLVLGIFKSFQKVKLLGKSEFAGLANYAEIFCDSQYQNAFWNSLLVGGGTFILQFAWGLLIAVLLNETRNKIKRSFFQTVTYIPYLLSWSVVGGLWISLLSPTGMVNGILKMLRGNDFIPIVFMSEEAYGRAIMIFTGAWKGSGYFAALFMAAIVGIDKSLYESARIDGAARIQQIRYIMLPIISPTMRVIAVLSVMGILRNFDQIFIMNNASISNKVQNLLVLIYEQGIIQFNVGTAAAAATIVLIVTLVITTFVKKLLKYEEMYS